MNSMKPAPPDVEQLRQDAHVVAQSCAGFRARAVSRKITQHFDAAMRGAGLTPMQFTLLVALHAAEPRSITDVAEAIGADRTTMTRNIAVLEKEGLLTVAPPGPDRRRALRLTAAGEAKLAAAMPLWRRAQDTLADRLGEDWPRVFENFEAVLRRL